MEFKITTGEEIRNCAEEVKKITDQHGGLKNVYCVACGGSLGALYPLEYLLRTESKNLAVYSVPANEFVHAPSVKVKEGTLVVLGSMTGTTPETVAAAKKAKELGATVVTMSGAPDTPLAKEGDFHLVYANSHAGKGGYDSTNLAFALRFGFELLRLYDNYAHYDKAMAGFDVLESQVTKAVKRCKKRAMAFGEAHKADPVIYTVASGPSYSVAYMESICMLLEMEWINSSCIPSGEMFHGPFEVVDFETPFVMFMSEGKTRDLDERALKFLQKYSGRVTIIDAKEMGVSIIAPEVEEYFSAIFNWEAAYVFSECLAESKNHPLCERRYMFKVEY